MSTYYNTHGVSARPKKRGGGLGSILGAMLGTGVSTGGVFNPAVDVDTLAREEFAGKGVDSTDEDASIDAWNEVRNAQVANGVTSKPASYEPYQLKNPILTQIFNPQLASQLESRNFAANQMMYNQQLQQDAAKQEYERRLALAQFEQNAYDNRQGEQTRAQREHTELQHRLGQQGADAGVDRNLRIAKGLPSNVDVAPLGEPGMQHAMALARAQAAASSSPEFGPAVQRNMLAGLDAQSIANWKNSIYTAQPNEMGMRYDVNKGRLAEVLPGVQSYKNENLKLVTTDKGVTYPAGTETTQGFRTTPGIDLLDREAKRSALQDGTAPKNPDAPKPKVSAKDDAVFRPPSAGVTVKPNPKMEMPYSFLDAFKPDPRDAGMLKLMELLDKQKKAKSQEEADALQQMIIQMQQGSRNF